jgi:predicted methyltransferase
MPTTTAHGLGVRRCPEDQRRGFLRRGNTLPIVWLLLSLFACGASTVSRPIASGAADESPQARAIVNARDRTDADRQIDSGRQPAALLTFLDVKPGMRVGELVAGAGYTAELLARAVGPDGVVYAENPLFVLQDAGPAWTKRLSTPVMKVVVRVDRELETPLPSEAIGLDLVVINLVYHDVAGLGIDRTKMNSAVFSALRSGGRYAVIDHSARPGSGCAYVQSLHRIDEATVREEVEHAGFRLLSESTFLRNPADARDWNDATASAGERRGTSDRFALMFVKP